jgi:hypothetical protein
MTPNVRETSSSNDHNHEEVNNIELSLTSLSVGAAASALLWNPSAFINCPVSDREETLVDDVSFSFSDTSGKFCFLKNNEMSKRARCFVRFLISFLCQWFLADDVVTSVANQDIQGICGAPDTPEIKQETDESGEYSQEIYVV